MNPIDEYTQAAVHRLLTETPELAEQGISVVRREHTLVLQGEVEGPRRRDEILRLVAEHFPDIKIQSDIGLIRTQPPSEAEELA
jgi:hypothetical protein